ncbi:hypothetical protein JCM3766R1_001479 [Sporobolomyces carnicolor]
MGRDRLDRIALSEGQCRNSRMEANRVEKSQRATINNLRDRREARELADMRAEIATLTQQLQLERDEALKRASAATKDSDRKAIERDLVQLEKQLKRSQDEVASVTSHRDELKRRVHELELALESDSRLVAVREELKQARHAIAQAKVQLGIVREESHVYRERSKVLESTVAQHEHARDQVKTVTQRCKHLEAELERLQAVVAKYEQGSGHHVETAQALWDKIHVKSSSLVHLPFQGKD